MQSPCRANDQRAWVSTPEHGSFSLFSIHRVPKSSQKPWRSWVMKCLCSSRAATPTACLTWDLLFICIFKVFESDSGRGCSSSICKWNGDPCPMDRTHSNLWKWQLCTVKVVLKCFPVLEPHRFIRPVRGKLQYDVTCSLVFLCLVAVTPTFSEAFLLLFSLLHSCHMTWNCGHADAACILLPIYYLPTM